MNNTQFNFQKIADDTSLTVNINDIIPLEKFGNIRLQDERDPEFYDSIKSQGILQSLLVRPSKITPNKVELVAGYGRFGAALKLNLQQVPVLFKHLSDEEALNAQFTENHKRSKLSPIEEAEFAAKYISLHNGDYASAAIALSITEKLLRERLQINRAIGPVKMALHTKDITLGHLLILSQFDEMTQENTLTKILENPSVYTVEHLKQLANKRKISLAAAPFDKSECSTCKHNTGAQLSLLPDDCADGQQMCAKPTCFNDKAINWTHTIRKAELENQFGRVLFLTDKITDETRRVNQEILGDEYNECISCDNKVVMLDDSPMKWGEYTENTCIDPCCHAEKLTAYNTHLASVKATKKETENSPCVAAKDDAVNQPKVEQKTAPIPLKSSGKIKKSVQDDYDNLLRESAAYEVSQDKGKQHTIMLASLIKTTGYNAIIAGVDTSQYLGFSELTALCQQISNEELSKHATAACIYQLEHGSLNTPIALAKQMAAPRSLTAVWQPTKERLNLYTIEQLKFHLYDLKVTDIIPQSELDALFKKSKAEIVEGILALEIDWTPLCPTELLGQI